MSQSLGSTHEDLAAFQSASPKQVPHRSQYQTMIGVHQVDSAQGPCRLVEQALTVLVGW
jgi:hypothetical protein